MVRIAVVDDDAVFVSLLQEVFGLYGWETVWNRDGGGTVSWLGNEHPDLVIVDPHTSLPDGGMTLLREREVDPVLAGIPMVVCSGDLPQLDVLRPWLEDRGIEALAKPVDLDALCAMVERNLVTDRAVVRARA